MVSLIIHGGAGNIPDGAIGAKRRRLESTLQESFELLRNGGSALHTVEFAVKSLEDDPCFNAGRGSYPNAEGKVEMDAIIVDGTNINFGAVAGIKNVKNPVSIARKVLEHGKCCLLAGEGATRFAHANGFEFVPDEDLTAETDQPVGALGTVGAVAVDSKGGIASATSTGGTARKPPGRVGDSPLIGCGAMADTLIGGVSATGEGEFLMRIMISRVVMEFLQKGLSPKRASRYAINLLWEKVEGKGGVICLNRDGEAGYAFNTPRMAVGYINESCGMSISFD